MTVPVETLAVGPYAGSGVLTSYPFNFSAYQTSDVDITVYDLFGIEVSPPNYTVTLNGTTGGTVNMVLPVNRTLYIQADYSFGQQLQFNNEDGFFPETHEEGFDRAALRDQQLKWADKRALRIPFGDAALGELPIAAQRAGRFLAFNSDGQAVATPVLGGTDIIGLDFGRIYMDYNGDAHPRIVLDPSGLGTSAITGQTNASGKVHAAIYYQDDVPYFDSSGSKVWLGAVFRNWDAIKPDQKRTRTGVTINVNGEIDAPFWATQPPPRVGDPEYQDYLYVQSVGGTWGVIPANPSALYDLYVAWINSTYVDDAGELVNHTWGDTSFTARYFPQAVVGQSLTVTGAAGRIAQKMEGLVVSARAAPSIAGGATARPMKLVAIQAITVQAVAGPAANAKNQITDDDTDTQDGFPGAIPGAFTLRLNAGTTGDVGARFRSWCAVLVGGRAGYYNGIVFGKAHGNTVDSSGVLGFGGVRGGRYAWAQDAWAVYGRDGMDGWQTIGHDGVTDNGDGTYSDTCRAPLDIKVPVDYTGPILMVNGVSVLNASGGAGSGSTVLIAPNGSQFLLGVDNDGAPTTTPI